MESVKVSIIVPIYNVEKFLPKCIESIINQEYKNIEIILVDDGSPDNSGVICEHYKKTDNRIVVIHKENAGVSEARNTGIDHAIGDYICFIDGDDFVMPDYVSYMLELALRYNADISLTTEMFGNFDEKQTKKDVIDIWNNEDAVEAILCYRVPIGCYCKLFKKDTLKQVRFLPDVFIGEGFNFNVDAFQHANKIVAGKKKTYFYRRDNPTSAMTKFSVKKCVCGLRALEIIKQKLIIHSERIEKAWKFANWRTHSDFYDMFVLSREEEKTPELYKKCLKTVKTDALIALNVPTNFKNKIRAVLMKVYPRLIPSLMELRRKKYIK